MVKCIGIALAKYSSVRNGGKCQALVLSNEEIDFTHIQVRSINMKHIQKALAAGILAITSSYASAASFTFTEVAGFTDTGAGVATAAPHGGVAYYEDALDANPDAPSATVSSTMFWYSDDDTPDSRLRLVNPGADTTLNEEVWTTISTLYHLNNTISPLNPATQGWIGQEILGRLILKDGGTEVFNDVDPITIDLKETTNTVPLAECEGGNPTGSPTPCDDYFSFTSIGLAPVLFQDLLGNTWKASFRLDNFVASAFGDMPGFEDKIFTREGVESSLDVQIFIEQVSEVPEPATLGIFGLGLLGLGLAKRRKQNA
jgi:hypothetical protein